ncbi:MAG: hypothetical protein GY845_29705 [Planctomycetes bacterium]|nr:hypothetical protein [Planctomycetota bacterium]
MKRMLITTLVAAFLSGCRDSEPQTRSEEQSQIPHATAICYGRIHGHDL